MAESLGKAIIRRSLTPKFCKLACQRPAVRVRLAQLNQVCLHSLLSLSDIQADLLLGIVEISLSSQYANCASRDRRRILGPGRADDQTNPHNPTQIAGRYRVGGLERNESIRPKCCLGLRTQQPIRTHGNRLESLVALLQMPGRFRPAAPSPKPVGSAANDFDLAWTSRDRRFHKVALRAHFSSPSSSLSSRSVSCGINSIPERRSCCARLARGIPRITDETILCLIAIALNPSGNPKVILSTSIERKGCSLPGEIRVFHGRRAGKLADRADHVLLQFLVIAFRQSEQNRSRISDHIGVIAGKVSEFPQRG